MVDLNVAAAQIQASDDPAANLNRVRAETAAAATAGAQLVVFPEATMARFGSRLRELAQPLDGPFAEGVRAIAAEYDVMLIVGMFTPAGGRRIRNTLLATGAGVEESYDKIHLYDAFGSRESDLVEPGTRHVVVEAFGTRIGLATCFDVRFADQFTALGRAGAEVIALSASWGEGPGKAEQWDLLTRARATDAQAWLVACGMAWSPSQGSAPLGVGRSAVIDPLGVVRARLEHSEGLLSASIDLGRVAAVREQVPVL